MKLERKALSLGFRQANNGQTLWLQSQSALVRPMRYVVMGSGEVGFHLARSLSEDGHEVTVIERNPDKIERVRAQLDANMVLGDGARRAVLELEHLVG